MKKPAERDCLALVPGYTGQAAKLFLTRTEEGAIVGVTVFDLIQTVFPICGEKRRLELFRQHGNQ